MTRSSVPHGTDRVLDLVKANVEFYGKVGAGLIFGLMMGCIISIPLVLAIWLWQAL